MKATPFEVFCISLVTLLVQRGLVHLKEINPSLWVLVSSAIIAVVTLVVAEKVLSRTRPGGCRG